MAPSRNKAVALLSGGLDSVVATAAAARSGEVALALTFDYGQRSRRREAAAARSVARALGVKWKRVALPWLAGLLPSSMRRAGKGLPCPREAELEDGDTLRAETNKISREPSSPDAGYPTGDPRKVSPFVTAARAVWVPNRNGVFLNVAAAFAESLGARAVVAGFNREEARAFPDNSPEFIRRATGALALSTLSKVRVVSPTAKLTKTGIVRLGMKLRAPMRFVWSCYGEGPKMCGECESCVRLLRALREARVSEEFWPRALARPRGK